ncbi:MAG: hypothetical protein IJF16_06545 [Clostridia bacterium]|nr:hypothetical protein [Clostridia bacterium]
MATFTNQARLSYNNKVMNSNIVTGRFMRELTATKTALCSDYDSESSITFVISITNCGKRDFYGLRVDDDLGEYNWRDLSCCPLDYVKDSARYYINGDLKSCAHTRYSRGLCFDDICVPAGGNAIIVYEAKVNGYAPLGIGDCIENCAVITGECLSEPVRASCCVEAAACPRLMISKSISPSVVTADCPVTYTFIIQNYGNTAADQLDSVVVSDVFDPCLSNIKVCCNGEDWDSPRNYNYNRSNGCFDTCAGEITVPAATYCRNDCGQWEVSPGCVVLTVTGTI